MPTSARTTATPPEYKSALKTPPVPRLSASLVIVNSQNQVLLVERNQATTFGGVHVEWNDYFPWVFPGGNFDPKQDESIHMTAVRETFEESGLLIATGTQDTMDLSPTQVEKARHAIHSQNMLFKDFLREHNLVVDKSILLPFTQWITPVYAARRFHAFFYVVFLSSSSSIGFTSGSKRDQIPTPDGGQEITSARFLHPLDAIAEFRSRKILFMPPQYYIISTLASILEGTKNTQEQRDTVQALSRGAFGTMTISPSKHPEPDVQGRTILTYEGDETRGGPPGQLHRSLVKLAEGGVVTTEIILQRNFDIYSGINWGNTSSKL